jgi:hypothetical protein
MADPTTTPPAAARAAITVGSMAMNSRWVAAGYCRPLRRVRGPDWQSVWQSGRHYRAERDVTGWTANTTRPATILHGRTRRTGRVSLLIRRCSRFEAAGGRSPWPRCLCGLPCLLPGIAHLGGGVSAGPASQDARNHGMGGVDRLSHASDEVDRAGRCLARSGCCPSAARGLGGEPQTQEAGSSDPATPAAIRGGRDRV